MKVLYLLRHAKSSWEDADTPDFDRPLNRRGRKAAKWMADHMRANRIHPAVVLCSPACRARETLEALKPALDDVPVTFDTCIYEASQQTLLARIGELPVTFGSALLIGHNPGLERLAGALATEGPALHRMREKFPTCGLAVLEARIETWSDLKAGSCRLDDLIAPE